MSGADNYLQYCAGWRDGAAIRFMDPDRSKHANKEFAAIYDRGYVDGQKARREAAVRAEAEFDYHPNIIRAQ